MQRKVNNLLFFGSRQYDLCKKSISMDLQLDKIDVLLHQISDEIQEVATLTRVSKNSTEDFQSTQENHSLNYNEDDFINIINGHQYIIDDLREAYKAISGARMQFAMIIQDHMSLMNKYDLHNNMPYSGDAESVYSRLCTLRDRWWNIFTHPKHNKKQEQFMLAHTCFKEWTKEIFSYTEYIGGKYNLLPSHVRLGSNRMGNRLGLFNQEYSQVTYSRRLITSPFYTMIVVIHELCHGRYPGHSREFWQLYEDICFEETLLQKKVLGTKSSLRKFQIHEIPYRWDLQVAVLTKNMKEVIEKSIRISCYSTKDFDIKNMTKEDKNA